MFVFGVFDVILLIGAFHEFDARILLDFRQTLADERYFTRICLSKQLVISIT